ncbi:MAG: DEAD/DEAH box helicase, partial [Phenylobacterium sp.]
PEITRLTKQFLNDPIRIEASRPATTAETITQYLVRIPTQDPKAKRTALRELIKRDDVKNGIVFCNRKSEVDIVAKSLKTHGFDAAAIHGDLDQQTRMRTLESFRNGSLKLLCASDVAARGLDIPDVSHVFNYDVPHHADDYVHRIGRTGRAGRSGQAFMIATPADSRNLDKVLKLIGKPPIEITLDLDWGSIKDEPRSSRGGERERGGRSRDRDRPDRDRRPKGERPRHEHASTEPFDPTAEVAPVAPRPERPVDPRRARGRRPAEEAAPAAEAPVDAAPREERAPREDRPPRRERQERSERPERNERPVAVAEAAPAPREADRGRRPDRNDRRDRPERDRPERDRPERDRGERQGRERDPDRVVGFGDETPAFLTRAAPVRPPED